jgi:DNA-binding Lrp family transcriptional regulator
MSLDWEIYRALYRSSDCPVWKAESHPDPSRLGLQAGSSRGTVWRRLREWRRSGFIQGHEIIPHPALFGVGLTTYEVKLSDPKARQLFLDELELVDGVFIANFALGPRTMVISIADRPASQARRAELIGRIPGVDSVKPSREVWLPARPRSLTTKEWKLISALREAPDKPFSALARAVGVSAKTFSRKYQLLRQLNGILTYRVEDFSKFSGTVATFSVTLSSEEGSRAIARQIEDRLPGLLELVFIDRPPYSPNVRLGYSTFVASASSMETAEAAVYEIPGVSGVQTMFIGGERAYRGWFDERIHQVIHSSAS